MIRQNQDSIQQHIHFLLNSFLVPQQKQQSSKQFTKIRMFLYDQFKISNQSSNNTSITHEFKQKIKQLQAIKLPNLKHTLLSILLIFIKGTVIQEVKQLTKITKNKKLYKKAQIQKQKQLQICTKIVRQFQMNNNRNPISHFRSYILDILNRLEIFKYLLQKTTIQLIKHLFFQHILSPHPRNPPDTQQSLKKLTINLLTQQKSNFSSLNTFKLQTIKSASQQLQVGNQLHNCYMYIWEMDNFVWVVYLEAGVKEKDSGQVVDVQGLGRYGYYDVYNRQEDIGVDDRQAGDDLSFDQLCNSYKKKSEEIVNSRISSDQQQRNVNKNRTTNKKGQEQQSFQNQGQGIINESLSYYSCNTDLNSSKQQPSITTHNNSPINNPKITYNKIINNQHTHKMKQSSPSPPSRSNSNSPPPRNTSASPSKQPNTKQLIQIDDIDFDWKKVHNKNSGYLQKIPYLEQLFYIFVIAVIGIAGYINLQYSSK